VNEDDQIKVISTDKEYRPKEMHKFTDVKFPNPFYKVFESLGFKKPTPIQKFGITIGMDHKDIIGVAKTGSGKTLAFILPGLCEIIEEKKYLNKNGVSFLVLLNPF
jgi:superfamily II DNA/RNA helicase